MLAVRNRFQYQILGNRLAANQFHHNINIRMRSDFVRIIGDDHALIRKAAGSVQIPICDHFDDDGTTRTTGYFFLVTLQDGIRAATHSANA